MLRVSFRACLDWIYIEYWGNSENHIEQGRFYLGFQNLPILYYKNTRIHTNLAKKSKWMAK